MVQLPEGMVYASCLGGDASGPQGDQLRTQDKQAFVMEIDDRHGIILIDTDCAKTVAGEPWAHAITKHFSDNYNYVIDKVVEKEPFRFGPGPRLWSEYALLVPCRRQGEMVILRVSIVKRDVPPLMAKRVLRELKAIMNLD